MYAVAKLYYTDGSNGVVKLDLDNWGWILDQLISMRGIEWLECAIFEHDVPNFEPDETKEDYAYIDELFGLIVGSTEHWIAQIADDFYDVSPSIIAPLLPYGLYVAEEDDGEVTLTPVNIYAASKDKADGVFYGEYVDGEYVDAPTRVINGITALRANEAGTDDIMADDDTAFFYVSDPGTDDVEVVVYTGIDNVPSITAKKIADSMKNSKPVENGFAFHFNYYGLNSYYAEKNVALAALCFTDNSKVGEQVYFYAGEPTIGYDEDTEMWVLTYGDLYLDGEKTDAKEYSFAKYKNITNDDNDGALDEFIAWEGVKNYVSDLKMKKGIDKYGAWVLEDENNLIGATKDGVYYDNDVLYIDAGKIAVSECNDKNLYFDFDEIKYADLFANYGVKTKDMKFVVLNDKLFVDEYADLVDAFEGELLDDEGEKVTYNWAEGFFAIEIDDGVGTCVAFYLTNAGLETLEEVEG